MIADTFKRLLRCSMYYILTFYALLPSQSISTYINSWIQNLKPSALLVPLSPSVREILRCSTQVFTSMGELGGASVLLATFPSIVRALSFATKNVGVGASEPPVHRRSSTRTVGHRAVG